MSKGPYVSFVTSGRNDGYTPGYVGRVSRSTTLLANQLERAKLPSEIVISEWNPPPDRPLLIEELELPSGLQYVSIRGIVVPSVFHNRFEGSADRGIQPGEAANVGIRRARGRFITSKSSDTFFTADVIATIARRDLDPDTMYRMDRYDVSISDDSLWSLDDDALLARFASLPSTRHALIRQSSFWELRDLHTNACGDFTLMTAAHWHLVRGHPLDSTVLSLDIDSLVMHAAAANGVQECRWPSQCRVYKVSHANLNAARVRQQWQPWQRKLDKFLSEKFSELTAHRMRTWFDYPRRTVRGVDSIIGPSIERNFVRPASRWAHGDRLVPSQAENWGLADETLEERTLRRAQWETASAA